MKIEIINFKNIVADNNLTLSARYNINKKNGKSPYILENGLYRPAKCSEYENRNVKYFTEKEVADSNEILKQKAELNNSLNNRLKNLENE